MSSNKRPWYKWYPRDFNQDEKVKGLSWDAELIYRRLLDVMWQSNDCQLPNDIDYLYNAVAIAIAKERFATAWLQIQREKFQLFIEKDGWIISERLKKEMEDVVKLSETRQKLGKKGGVAKAIAIAKQKLYQSCSDTDTDTDIKKIYKRKIPDFFPLTKELKIYALTKGILKNEVEGIFEHFKNHHGAKGTLMLDWNKCWYTWVRNEIKFNPEKYADRKEYSQESIEELCS
jgi:hypothetical protein